MLQVTQAAVNKIKEELQGMAVDFKEPYIRLHMGIG